MMNASKETAATIDRHSGHRRGRRATEVPGGTIQQRPGTSWPPACRTSSHVAGSVMLEVDVSGAFVVMDPSSEKFVDTSAAGDVDDPASSDLVVAEIRIRRHDRRTRARRSDRVRSLVPWLAYGLASVEPLVYDILVRHVRWKHGDVGGYSTLGEQLAWVSILGHLRVGLSEPTQTHCQRPPATPALAPEGRNHPPARGPPKAARVPVPGPVPASVRGDGRGRLWSRSPTNGRTPRRSTRTECDCVAALAITVVPTSSRPITRWPAAP